MVDAVNPYLSAPLYTTSYLSSYIKPARPDIIFQDDVISIETMTDLFIEDLGGEELLTVARTFSINNPLIQSDNLIKNASEIKSRLNPLQILLPNIDNGSRTIDFNKYLSSITQFRAAEINSLAESTAIEYDTSTGDITINLINIKDELVEYQVAQTLAQFDDTIY